jgi:hypothetical protein
MVTKHKRKVKAKNPVAQAEDVHDEQVSSVPCTLLFPFLSWIKADIALAQKIPVQSLPINVLDVLGEHLIARDWHRTCAPLNATSKAVREETTPAL